MPTLVLKGQPGSWFPTPIKRLDDLLANAIHGGRGYTHVYALRRNIAYSLQHIEYLERMIADVQLTSVLITQTWKTEIIVGCSIIESLLHYLIQVTGNQTTTEWETKQEFTGGTKRVDGQTYRIDSVMKQKLATPKPLQMTFDTMLKKAESKFLLGTDRSIYSRLKRLRPLRNRVHLQEIAQPIDTDFNAFGILDQRLMMQVLHMVFTGPTFSPSAEQRRYFVHLEKHLNTPA